MLLQIGNMLVSVPDGIINDLETGNVEIDNNIDDVDGSNDIAVDNDEMAYRQEVLDYLSLTTDMCVRVYVLLFLLIGFCIFGFLYCLVKNITKLW